MYPEIFSIGPFTVQGYGLMIFIGVLLAYLYMLANLRHHGLKSEDVSEMFLWCFASVVLGGKIFFWLEEPGKYISDPQLLFKSFGNGFVFYGSFLFTVPVLIFWFKRKKIDPWVAFDYAGIAGALVHVFGKIGCLLAGCCHGRVSNAPNAIIFTNPNCHASPLNTPLYPTQVWDAMILFSAIGLMIWLKRKKWFDGQIFLTYGMIYAVGRFFTEKYRGDEERGFVLNGLLSHSQAIAIGVFAVCAAIFIMRYRKTQTSHAV
jgi:phosphatidylglycerol:prolipoprotein diacylglycerol transferase